MDLEHASTLMVPTTLVNGIMTKGMVKDHIIGLMAAATLVNLTMMNITNWHVRQMHQQPSNSFLLWLME